MSNARFHLESRPDASAQGEFALSVLVEVLDHLQGTGREAHRPQTTVEVIVADGGEGRLEVDEDSRSFLVRGRSGQS